MARLRGFFILVALLLLGALPVHAQNFPPLTGRVVDAANIIPDADEAALTAKLEALEAQSGRQLVVATIPDLQGYPIEDYGYQLGRAWKIGEKAVNNGALLVVAPNERKLRVEVGYGLEPILTDLFSGVIIRDVILPRFKANDYPGGINAGVDALAVQLTLPPEEAAKRAKMAGAKSQKQDVSLSSIIFWLFIFFFFILPMLRSMFGGKRGRRMGGAPVIIWGPSDWGGGSGGGGSSWGGGGGGGFSGGGGSFGGGGASGSW
jgi:uncharacterized protein